MEQPKEAEVLKLCLCSSGVKSSEIKPGTNPKCVFCAMRSYGYYTEYKLADRGCNTVGAKDSDSFQDRNLHTCLSSDCTMNNNINELQLWLAGTSHTPYMTKIMVQNKYPDLRTSFREELDIEYLLPEGHHI